MAENYNKSLGLHGISNKTSSISQLKEAFRSDWVFVGWERWFIAGCFAFTVFTAIKFIIRLF